MFPFIFGQASYQAVSFHAAASSSSTSINIASATTNGGLGIMFQMALDTLGSPNETLIPSGFTSFAAGSSAGLGTGPFGVVVASYKVLNGTEGSLTGLMTGNLLIANHFVCFTKGVPGTWTMRDGSGAIGTNPTISLLAGGSTAPGLIVGIAGPTSGSPAGMPDFSLGTEGGSNSNSATRAIWNLYQKVQAMPNCDVSVSGAEAGVIGGIFTTS